MNQDYWLRLLLYVGLFGIVSACDSLDDPIGSQQSLPVPQVVGIADEEGVTLNWGWWLAGQEDVEAQSDWELLIYISDKGADQLELVSVLPVKPFHAQLNDLRLGTLYYVSVALTNPQGDTVRSNIIGVARTKQPSLEPIESRESTGTQNGTWVNTYEIIYERIDPTDSVSRLYQYDMRTEQESYLVPGADPDWSDALGKLAYRTLKDPSIGLNATAINTFSPNAGGGVDAAFGGEQFYAQPSWSHDGEVIVCLTLDEQQNQYDMVQYYPQKGGLPDVVSTKELVYEAGETAAERSPQHPIWWPGQEKVVFDLMAEKVAEAHSYQARDIFSIVPGTSELSPLIQSPWNDLLPAFSTDGTQIAFLSDRAGYLAVWVYHLQRNQWEQWNSPEDVPIISPDHKLEWSPRAKELLITCLHENQPPSLVRFVRNE